MADMDDREADRSPWTIKGMTRHVRERAKNSALKADETMAEWLSAAIMAWADRQDGTQVLPPDERADPPADSTAVTSPAVDMAGLADLLSAAAAAAQAAGVPLSKTMARQAMALTVAQLRLARGLPEKPVRQTKRQNGQTGPFRLIEEAASGGAPAAAPPDGPGPSERR